jgi:hypothetical protein
MSGLAEKLPDTNERVELHTAPEINESIRQQIEANVASCAGANREVISDRLHAIEREWDMERTLEANAATVVLLGTALGFAFNKKWFALSGFAATFLLQHALHGWCPPVPFWRRRGVRTQREIYEEKTALKVLRGDFQPTTDPRKALAQARRP